ncbi:A24 family peptidase [Desulfofalx alkaliphila]|uniref:prepilin peptidase n=1 Tax=Desulfofalx alkaliphila TaxID=105483 RepID=UPI0004E1505B|nr:A24 family peptidase [Desulfofalx alkaliphila]
MTLLVQLGLAATFVGITTYTDAKQMKIYNKHVFPFFLIGFALAVISKNYELLISAVIVFGVFLFIYNGGRVMSKLIASMGGLPLSSGQKPMAGGDVKLATTLALYLGFLPVLYGTILACVFMVVLAGIKAWRTTGNSMAVAFVATGKMPAKPVPIGALMGPCSLVIALLFLI